MTRKTSRIVERNLLRLGGDLDDLSGTLTARGARGLHRCPDRRANTLAAVKACVARIEFCVRTLREERRGKL